MKALQYSTDRYSDLNHARRALWCAKDMLGAANAQPHLYSKSFWMGRINEARSELRKIAHQVRAELAGRQARAGK